MSWRSRLSTGQRTRDACYLVEAVACSTQCPPYGEGCHGQPGRIIQYQHEQPEQIMTDWAAKAEQAASARGLDQPELRNILPWFLSALADGPDSFPSSCGGSGGTRRRTGSGSYSTRRRSTRRPSRSTFRTSERAREERRRSKQPAHLTRSRSRGVANVARASPPDAVTRAWSVSRSRSPTAPSSRPACSRRLRAAPRRLASPREAESRPAWRAAGPRRWRAR